MLLELWKVLVLHLFMYDSVKLFYSSCKSFGEACKFIACSMGLLLESFRILNFI